MKKTKPRKQTHAESARSSRKLKISREFKNYFLHRLSKHKQLDFCCTEFDFNPKSLFVVAEQCLPNIDAITNAVVKLIDKHFGSGDAGQDFAYQIAQLCGVPNQNDSWKLLFEKKELKYLVEQINYGYWDTYEGPSLGQTAKIIANEFLELPKVYNKHLLECPLCPGIDKSNQLHIDEFGDEPE